MSEYQVIQLAVDLLWLVLLLSLPTVVIASFTGLIVSLVQTLTQLQDQTLQFLIKLVAVCVTLVATYHWMGDSLLNYTGRIFGMIGQIR